MALDTVMIWISAWGGIIPLFCVLATQDKKTIVRSMIALLLTYGISNLVKDFVAKPRPFVVGDAQLIGSAPEGFSFPSKHASLTFTLATVAFLKKKILGKVAFVSAALVAYSRVYLGVHYWSDIIAGAILGIAVAYGVDKLMTHFKK